MHLRLLLILLPLIAITIPGLAQNHARFSDIKPGMVNRELEYAGVREANKKAAQLGCREEYTQATITSASWELFYEDGELLGRKIHMEVYGRTWEGQCGVTHFLFRQKYLGHHEYAKLKCDEINDFYTLECE